MVSFIEPLELRTWFVNVMAGSTPIFTAIALLTIFALAGYFRMNFMITVFLLGIFLTLFVGSIDQSLYYVVLAVGGLIAGMTFNKIMKR